MDYGWWSLVPPVVAIGLAIATRRVIASLLLGSVIGVLILKDWSANWNPLTAIADLLENHLWASLCDPEHLRVFVFTALMGAMIGVIHRMGGMHGVVRSLAPLARTRRSGQVLTWVLGLLIFIDDYANTLLLGNTMRPLTDRLGISREKLAYLVDSTAAPVAGLAVISTWVAGEISYIQTGFDNLGLPAGTVDCFSVFVATIPYRFYVLWALMFVPLIAILGRDFGPMLRAERKALHPARRTPTGLQSEPDAVADDVPHRWYNAVVPVLVTLGVTVWLLLLTGAHKLNQPLAIGDSSSSLIEFFNNGNSYLALVYGSLAGLLVAMLMAAGQRLLTFAQSREAAFNGARLVLPALAILWLAWTISGITGKEYLGTGEFLGGLLQNSLDARWMPTIVFVLSSFVAFSTGTSWGTMAILMPIVVGATYRMIENQAGSTDPYAPLLMAAIGSVLSGAIFGDHCSPISDTTVLSSQSSGCNHVAHVWTQLPYALLVAVVAILCGTVPVGFGISVWPLLALGLLVMIVLLRIVGRRLDESGVS